MLRMQTGWRRGASECRSSEERSAGVEELADLSERRRRHIGAADTHRRQIHEMQHWNESRIQTVFSATRRPSTFNVSALDREHPLWSPQKLLCQPWSGRTCTGRSIVEYMAWIMILLIKTEHKSLKNNNKYLMVVQ